MSGFISRQIERFFREITAEGKRQAAHGASETAAAIFNGNAHVMYGPGQHMSGAEQPKTGNEASHDAPGREMGGREV